jgi:hypothetical protein
MSNIDNIISLLKKYTTSELPKEFQEQDTKGGAGGSSTGGGAKYPTVTKWETGIKRGPANPVKLGKWKDVNSPNRGKANTLL